MEQKHKQYEIIDGVIRAIGSRLVLRSYLKSFKDLSFNRLKIIVRSHYRIKNTTELYENKQAFAKVARKHHKHFNANP